MEYPSERFIIDEEQTQHRHEQGIEQLTSMFNKISRSENTSKEGRIEAAEANVHEVYEKLLGNDNPVYCIYDVNTGKSYWVSGNGTSTMPFVSGTIDSALRIFEDNFYQKYADENKREVFYRGKKKKEGGYEIHSAQPSQVNKPTEG